MMPLPLLNRVLCQSFGWDAQTLGKSSADLLLQQSASKIPDSDLFILSHNMLIKVDKQTDPG